MSIRGRDCVKRFFSTEEREWAPSLGTLTVPFKKGDLTHIETYPGPKEEIVTTRALREVEGERVAWAHD